MATHAFFYPAERSLDNPGNNQIDNHQRYKNLVGCVGLGHNSPCDTHHIEQRDGAGQSGALHEADGIITVCGEAQSDRDGAGNIDKSLAYGNSQRCGSFLQPAVDTKNPAAKKFRKLGAAVQ